MSSAVYSSVLNEVSGLLPATADTSFTAPTNVTSLNVGGALGTQIYELLFQGVGTTALGLINVWLFKAAGSVYSLVDSVLITVITPSATVQPLRFTRRYGNLFVPNGSTLRISGTVAGNQSLVMVTGTGADIA